ncbi:MAG: hypothetical protein JNJ69_05565 [Leptospiraceae bacterium]|nr:hypothetical protein [Leptospiraceae bacterium]
MAPRVPTQLYFIHLALMLSPALFAVVIFLIILPGASDALPAKEDVRVYQTVAAALAVIGVGFSQLVPRFMMRRRTQLLLRQYISMKIEKWALVEGAALTITVVFYLTHEKNLLISLGVLIALMAFMRPTADEMAGYNVKG